MRRSPNPNTFRFSSRSRFNSRSNFDSATIQIRGNSTRGLPYLADQIDSIEDGRRLVWPLVADEFARFWKLPKPPSTHR